MPKKIRTEIENFYVSYSDMVTLLLIMFIYFFSISEIDPVKFQEMSTTMKSQIKANVDTSEIQRMRNEKQKLIEMKQQIEGLIKEKGLSEKVSVEYNDGQLILNVGDAILFEKGKAELKTEARQILGVIGILFIQSDSLIWVEGHTDNIPIASTVYPSNWELSSARSSSVVRFLESIGVASKRCSVIGYNQHKPLLPNTSEANRMKNRRVVVRLKVNVNSKASKL